MKRTLTTITGILALAFLLAAPGFAGQEVIISQASAQYPETHSEKLQTLMQSSWSDSPDRTFDILAQGEKRMFEIDLRISDLKKELVYSDSQATQAKLDNYVAARKQLETIQADAHTLQKNIAKGINTWTNVEKTAAAGEKVNPKRFEKLDKTADTAKTALKSMNAAADKLQSIAKELNNPQLVNFAEFVKGEHKPLSKVVALTAEPEGGNVAQAAPSAPVQPAAVQERVSESNEY